MLKFQERAGTNILEAEASGVLTRGEYMEFTNRLESLAQECGKVRILCELRDFKGLEASSAWNGSISRLRDKGLVQRFAVIGEEKARPWMGPLAEPFTEVKFFTPSQREDAVRWVSEGVREEAEKQRISRLAYAKWEEAGRPPCDGARFWLEAEREARGPAE